MSDEISYDDLMEEEELLAEGEREDRELWEREQMEEHFEIERIAEGLSEAQRDALLGDPNDDMESSVAMSLSLSLRLMRPVSIEPPRMGWSSLGLAVRTHLQEQSK